ncbi:MAG: type II toxin-antitoxin system VapB family antitoxin [Euzebya sp.]
MARTRISTTVSDERLTVARSLADWRNDAELMDAALEALIERNRSGVIDAAYRDAYDATPIDTADEWGDLSSFRDAAART